MFNASTVPELCLSYGFQDGHQPLDSRIKVMFELLIVIK